MPEKAMPFLTIDEATPSETQKTITKLKEKNQALTTEVETLQSELKITRLAMEKFAKETAQRLRKLEAMINKYQKAEIQKQNEEILTELSKKKKK